MSEAAVRSGLTLHPVTKLLLVLLGNLTLFVHVDTLTEASVTALLLLLLLLCGRSGSALRMALVYCSMLAAERWLVPNTSGVIAAIAGMWASGFRVMLPCLIAGILAFSTTSIGEWVFAMRRLHISESIIIPCMVVIRFFPTVAEDYRQIRGAMRLRGVFSGSCVLLYPLKYLEYVLIPILMNAANVSQDLSVSALTRGLGVEGPHTCMTELSVHPQDFLAAALCTLPFLLWAGGVL